MNIKNTNIAANLNTVSGIVSGNLTGVGSGDYSSSQSANLDNQVKRLQNTSKNSEKELDKAASGFEALLLHNMLEAMWKTVDTTGSLMGDDSNQAQIFRDMLNQALSDKISQGKGIGVKDFLKKEIHRKDGASEAKDEEKIS
jgi:peptidoglycan hydrolase FlgJ